MSNNFVQARASINPGDVRPIPLWHRDGISWHEARLPARFHRCKVQTYGTIGLYRTERCACGAIRRVPGPWGRAQLAEERMRQPPVRTATSHCPDGYYRGCDYMGCALGMNCPPEPRRVGVGSTFSIDFQHDPPVSALVGLMVRVVDVGGQMWVALEVAA